MKNLLQLPVFLTFVALSPDQILGTRPWKGYVPVSELKVKDTSEAASLRGLVFFHQSSFDKKKFTLSEATKACLAFGSTVASPVQLRAAHDNGLRQCDYGWINDKSVRLSAGKTDKESCPGAGVGIISLGLRDPSERYDVYCYTKAMQGEVFLTSHRFGFSYSEAQEKCLNLAATLATTAQLSHAWRDGLEECRPGWLRDGVVRFPVSISTSKCGGGDPGPITFFNKIVYKANYKSAFPDRNFRYDAFCFRANRLRVGFGASIASLIVASEAQSFAGLVFFYQPSKNAYQKVKVQDRPSCEYLGAELATEDQLRKAYENGLHQCDYGWVKFLHIEEGSSEVKEYYNAQYPIVRVGMYSCTEQGEFEPGIRTAKWPLLEGIQGKQTLSNLYCYAQVYTKGEMFYLPGENNGGFTFWEAFNACAGQRGFLAFPASLSSAWKDGFDECRPGWLSDKSVRFPTKITTNLCGGGKQQLDITYQASYQVGFPNEFTLYGAYCYRT